MGKSSPSQPAAPDPVATANAQAAANKESAIATGQLNMINQVTPYGNLSYEQRGTTAEGTPQYTATTTLSPQQQQMLDLTNQAGITYGQTANNQLNSLAGTLAQPLDLSSIGPVPQADQGAWDTAYNALVSRNQPQADRQLQQIETRLASQGIPIGSAAWKAAMDDYNRGQNDFGLAAQGAATGEMATRYGLSSQAFNQAANTMMQQRSQPLNELAAMLTGAQVQAPSFVSTPVSTVQPADVIGATYASYNGALNNYNQQVGSSNAFTGGLFGLGGALGGGYLSNPSAFSGFSDRRLKRIIAKIGEFAGMGVYRFRYIWGGPEVVGVMADEVRRVLPDAVFKVGDFDAIVFRRVLEA